MLEIRAIRPECEPKAVQIDAYNMGEYVGQITYYGCKSIKEAKARALKLIRVESRLPHFPDVQYRN